MRQAVLVWLVMAVVWGAGVSNGADHRPSGKTETLIRLAQAGDPQAMVRLGLAYYHGDGLLKDPSQARCWIKQAHDHYLEHGRNQAAKKVEEIWNELQLWQYGGGAADCSPEARAPSGPADTHTGPANVYREPVTGMRLIWVRGRCPGNGGGGSGEDPGSNCIDGFWMGETEVTQDQWTAVMETNPSRFKGGNLPVEQVSYEDVKTFIRRLNQAAGLKFSLPTEAQWAYACSDRGRRKPFPWGKEDFRPQANCGGCDSGPYSGRTAPVGSFSPNDLGLYDMGGNVREWCREKGGASAHDRPVMGGSFADHVDRSGCREAAERFIPAMRSHYIGFRLAAKERD